MAAYLIDGYLHDQTPEPAAAGIYENSRNASNPGIAIIVATLPMPIISSFDSSNDVGKPGEASLRAYPEYHIAISPYMTSLPTLG